MAHLVRVLANIRTNMAEQTSEKRLVKLFEGCNHSIITASAEIANDVVEDMNILRAKPPS
eukprot:1598280-Amphidinium_carterae.1